MIHHLLDQTYWDVEPKIEKLFSPKFFFIKRTTASIGKPYGKISFLHLVDALVGGSDRVYKFDVLANPMGPFTPHKICQNFTKEELTEFVDENLAEIKIALIDYICDKINRASTTIFIRKLPETPRFNLQTFNAQMAELKNTASTALSKKLQSFNDIEVLIKIAQKARKTTSVPWDKFKSETEVLELVINKAQKTSIFSLRRFR